MSQYFYVATIVSFWGTVLPKFQIHFLNYQAAQIKGSTYILSMADQETEADLFPANGGSQNAMEDEAVPEKAQSIFKGDSSANSSPSQSTVATINFDRLPSLVLSKVFRNLTIIERLRVESGSYFSWD